MKQTEQTGRSMVEMLGVLAIIGVLSIGGIAGYTTALNKHKANQILNAASMRAMAVASQLQNGKAIEDVSLGEFDNEDVGGANFGGVTDAGNNRFTIGFDTEPSPAVLTQMKNVTGDESIVRDIADNGALTYNNDLSTGVRASDFNGDADPENATKCTDHHFKWCPESQTCLSDTTADCPETEENEAPPQCLNGTVWNGEECTCPSGVVCSLSEEHSCENDGIWIQDHCLCPPGYFGDRCEIQDSVCQNGGRWDGLKCVCPSKYYGINCQFEVETMDL